MHHYQLMMFVGLLAVVLRGTIATADHQQLRVPPVDEIVLIDPHVHPEGKPRPILVPNFDGLTQGIEVPPTVIYHRYYYTGDRSFQGPMLPGGVSLVVANHPLTGEQIALEVQLLPGAPRIHYTKCGIRYEYGDTCIIVKFGVPGLTGSKSMVQKESGVEIWSKSVAQKTTSQTKEWLRRSGVPHALQHANDGAKGALRATADRIHNAGSVIARPAVGLWESTPIGGLLTPRPEDRVPETSDETGIVAELEGTVPTLR